jgi:hypothetical protein
MGGTYYRNWNSAINATAPAPPFRDATAERFASRARLGCRRGDTQET